MQAIHSQKIIEDAISEIVETSSQSTDGRWLEVLTAQVAAHIKEWDVSEAYRWSDWPERQIHFSGTTTLDVGIDVVAIRRSDGEHIAIQCKSRQLDEHGRGADISARETDRFITTSTDEFWAERWLVTSGDNRLSSPSRQVLSTQPNKLLKEVNIHKDLLEERGGMLSDEDCPHCCPHADDETSCQTKTCMQNEAVAESVRILQEHVRVDSGGLPTGQAHGKIVLPCGTGKTRISLRIQCAAILGGKPGGTPAIMKMLGYDTKGTDYCPAISHTGLLRDDGDDVYLAGCAAGTGTVEIRRESDSKLLDRYTISVGPTPTPTPTQLPTTGGSISGQTGQVGGVSPVGTTPTATVIPTPTPTPVPTSGGNR